MINNSVYSLKFLSLLYHLQLNMANFFEPEFLPSHDLIVTKVNPEPGCRISLRPLRKRCRKLLHPHERLLLANSFISDCWSDLCLTPNIDIRTRAAQIIDVIYTYASIPLWYVDRASCVDQLSQLIASEFSNDSNFTNWPLAEHENSSDIDQFNDFKSR